MKKIRIIILIILMIIILIVGSITIVEYNKYKKSVQLLGEGLTLIRNGEYEAGLEKCHQMPYFKIICYRTLFGLKLGRNETITSDVCEGLVLDIPFWEHADQQSTQAVKEYCDCMVQYNDKERCKAFFDQYWSIG